MLVFVGVPKKQVLILVKECLSSRVDELGSESKNEQTKSNSFLLLCSFMWVAPRRCGSELALVF